MQPERSSRTALPATFAGEIASRLAEAGVPGAAIALHIDGQPASLAVGFRDLDKREPLAAGDRFYLYSITKLLLAVATLRLVEQGPVALDQPACEIVPDVALDARITVRRLLNHTAGLPDYGALPAYHHALRAHPTVPWTQDEFLRRTLANGLLFPPGEGWAYSNVGYLLVRRVVERVMGASLRDTLARLIFAPLGLTQTVVAETLEDAAALTPGYSADLDRDGRLHDITRRYHPSWVAHGVVISTAPELARIIDALFAGELLAPASLAAMRQAVIVPGNHPPFVAPGYGLGLMVGHTAPFGWLGGHAGGGPGYATAAFHAPDIAGHRITAVALLNRDHPSLATDVVFALLDHARR